MFIHVYRKLPLNKLIIMKQILSFLCYLRLLQISFVSYFFSPHMRILSLFRSHEYVSPSLTLPFYVPSLPFLFLLSDCISFIFYLFALPLSLLCLRWFFFIYLFLSAWWFIDYEIHTYM